MAGLAAIALASCQKAQEPYMTLETKTLHVDQEGGTAVVTLSSNVYYRVNNDCHDSGGNYWARIADTSVDGDLAVLTFEVDENLATEERTGTVRFIGDDVTPLKLTIVQGKVIPRGIEPVAASAGYSETSATFSVYCDGQWTASCTDNDVTVSPSSGFGETTVTVGFPENAELSARTLNIDVDIEGDRTYTYTLTQGKYAGIIADWNLKEMVEQTKETFIDAADQTEFPGTNGKYLDASSGSGRIEYWACDRTGYSKSKYVCLRQVGGNGDPYVSGAIPGDWWTITSDYRNTTIPAGTKIHFYFVTKFGAMVSSYWMIEYRDGEEWKPAIPVLRKTESATQCTSGAEISYSAEIAYNFAGLLLDSSTNGAYIAVEGTFTTENDMDNIVLRFGQAGHLGLEGNKNYNGLYIDQTHSSGQTRFSAQRPSNADGTAVKQYDQHVTIEFVE